MEYIKANEKDAGWIFTIVQDTIRTIYPQYYPGEVVDFFCELHCKEHISEDIRNGHVGVFLSQYGFAVIISFWKS